MLVETKFSGFRNATFLIQLHAVLESAADVNKTICWKTN